MSKQSSLHPDERQETKAKSRGRKEKSKPWVVSSRYYLRWGKIPGWTKWSVDGRYITEEQANQVIDKKRRDYGGTLASFYEFKLEYINRV